MAGVITVKKAVDLTHYAPRLLYTLLYYTRSLRTARDDPPPPLAAAEPAGASRRTSHSTTTLLLYTSLDHFSFYFSRPAAVPRYFVPSAIR